MEPTTSFDLNQAIQSWREQLAHSAAVGHENLAELESHLRDSVSELKARGLSEEESFLIAARRLGKGETLAQEFGKVNTAALWGDRALWMLAGMLALLAGQELCFTTYNALVLVGSAFKLGGFGAGWLGTAGGVVMLLILAAGMWQLARGRLYRVHPGSRWSSRHPILLSVAAVGGILLLKASRGLIQAIHIQNVGARVLGETTLISSYFYGVFSIVTLVVMALLLSRLHLRRERNSVAQRASRVAMLAPVALAFALLPAQAGAGTATEKAATLDEAMTLWRAGKKDEAAVKFLAVDFSKRPLFPAGSALNFTEAQFIALPQAPRDKLARQMNDDLQAIKQLAAHVKSAGDTAKTAGDKARAASCTNQLLKCGDAFDQPDSLALLKLVGKAFKKMAAGPVVSP